MKLLLGVIVAWMPALAAVQDGLPGDPREQILELFRKIEKDLQEIDKLLLEAGSVKSAQKNAEAGKEMEKILEQTVEGQKRVVDAIEEILRKLPPDGQSSSGSSSSQSSQGSNKDPKNPQETQREQTPFDPGQMPQQGEEPKSSEKDTSAGRNRPANPPVRPPADPVNQANEAGKWGELPPLYQELFRNQKTDDVPLRYRRWIEQYYRRSNEAKKP